MWPLECKSVYSLKGSIQNQVTEGIAPTHTTEPSFLHVPMRPFDHLITTMVDEELTRSLASRRAKGWATMRKPY